MPKRKEPELKPAEQFKRFREAAKQHGLDESGKELEEAFAKVAKGDKPKKPEAR
jgi:hypothetical protein